MKLVHIRMLIDLHEEQAFNPRLLFELAVEGDDGGHIGKTVTKLVEAGIRHFVGTLEVLPEYADILIQLNDPEAAPIRDALHAILAGMASSNSEDEEGQYCLPKFMAHSLFGYQPIGGIPFSKSRRNTA